MISEVAAGVSLITRGTSLLGLIESAGRNKRAILPPSTYSEVAVVFADLSGFSGYVRDTPSDRTIQECLTAFCSKARYQIINDGGMLYQFLGDSVQVSLPFVRHRFANHQERSRAVKRMVNTGGGAIGNTEESDHLTTICPGSAEDERRAAMLIASPIAPI